MAKTLAANPRGRQIAANAIEFENGVTITLKISRDAPESLQESCSVGWFCAYEHSDFGGDIIGAPDCHWVDYRFYSHVNDTGTVENWSKSISSVKDMTGDAWNVWTPTGGGLGISGWEAYGYVGDVFNDRIYTAEDYECQAGNLGR